MLFNHWLIRPMLCYPGNQMAIVFSYVKSLYHMKMYPGKQTFDFRDFGVGHFSDKKQCVNFSRKCYWTPWPCRPPWPFWKISPVLPVRFYWIRNRRLKSGSRLWQQDWWSAMSHLSDRKVTRQCLLDRRIYADMKLYESKVHWKIRWKWFLNRFDFLSEK